MSLTCPFCDPSCVFPYLLWPFCVTDMSLLCPVQTFICTFSNPSAHSDWLRVPIIATFPTTLYESNSTQNRLNKLHNVPFTTEVSVQYFRSEQFNKPIFRSECPILFSQCSQCKHMNDHISPGTLCLDIATVYSYFLIPTQITSDQFWQKTMRSTFAIHCLKTQRLL